MEQTVESFKPFLPRILSFAIVSGSGWLIDVTLFGTLLLYNMRVIPANLTSAFVGITFTFIISTRAIFYYQGNFLLLKFLAYVFYNACAILFFSSIIQYISLNVGISPLLAKVMVTPATFYLNFLFMGLLLNHKIQLA